MDKEEKKLQPIMIDVVTDARMSLDKIAEVLAKINAQLRADEKVELKQEFEGLSYSAAMILMDAEMELEAQDKEGN